MGVAATTELVTRLRTRVRVDGVRSISELRPLLREELVRAIGVDVDRACAPCRTRTAPRRRARRRRQRHRQDDHLRQARPRARRDGRSVVLGAADTFRAAAADQLQTWGDRVGAQTVRGPEGGDPASVAFDAVAKGRADGADTVLVDTAGRLHTKTGLMDELGKVKRVSRSTARSTRRCSCSTPPPAERRRPGPRLHRGRHRSPASCSPSSTAPPRAASWWRCSASSASR
jgi:fused signal recognition particle receptor